MRNFATEYKPLGPGRYATGLAILLLLSSGLGAEQVFTITSEDMVAIRADEAWEDIEPDTVHFAGHFEMHIRDLVLIAERASLYGKLENPDRLVLQGSPARFTLSRIQGESEEAIEAEAGEITYERQSDWILLKGDARLALGENVLRSINIEYNVKTDRFRTRDHTGVEIKMRP